jgi:plasmid stabilization system protein ParE
MITINWSDLSLYSVADIVFWYESNVDAKFADSVRRHIEDQIQIYAKPPLNPNSIPNSDIYPEFKRLVISKYPYIAFIRQIDGDLWEVVDVVHTSRKLPSE